jgi:hypothetical protein
MIVPVPVMNAAAQFLASGDILSLQAFERMLAEAVCRSDPRRADATNGVRVLPGENDRRLVILDYVETLRRNFEGDE